MAFYRTNTTMDNFINKWYPKSSTATRELAKKHIRLADHHYNNKSNDSYDYLVKYAYHDEVAKEILRKNRPLSANEKKKLFNNAISVVFGDSKKHRNKR